MTDIEDTRIDDQPLMSASVLDGLSALVNSNLVQVIGEQDGATRFTMLETVGEYAREQLVESGQERDSRLRHARHFQVLAETMAIALRSSKRRECHDRLVADLGNFRAAVNWAIENGETDLALGLTAPLYWSWLQLGQFREAQSLSEAALALSGGTARSLARARTMMTAGSFAWVLGDVDSARRRLSEGAVLSAEIGDRQGQGLAGQFLGLLALSQGEYAEARVRLRDSVARFREIEDDWNLANSLFILGDAVVRTDPNEAQTLYEESLAKFRQLGDPWGIALPLTGLGGMALQRGEFATARALFAEGLELRQDVHDRWVMAISLTSLGEVARMEGEFAEAEKNLRDGLAIFREVGDGERVAWALYALGCIAEDQADHTAAGAHFAESLELRWHQNHRPGMAASLYGLARVAAAVGSPERAVRFLAAANSLPKGAGDPAPPDERLMSEQLLERISAILSQEAFTATWEQGRMLPINQVVADALVLDADPS